MCKVAVLRVVWVVVLLKRIELEQLCWPQFVISFCKYVHTYLLLLPFGAHSYYYFEVPVLMHSRLCRITVTHRECSLTVARVLVG